MKREPLLVLVGLTASGKKNVGLGVAKRVNAEIISLDSIKVYRGMDIGSAKPTALDRAEVPFHLLDILDCHESYSVGQFLIRAREVMEDILERGKRVLFLGGTAFYLNCLLNGLIEGVSHDTMVRRKLLEKAEQEGPQSLYVLLKKEDPASAAKIHPNDTKRIVRALEVAQIAGHPLSWLKEHRTRRIISGPFLVAGLMRPALERKERIVRRTHKMIAKGLVDEVRAVLKGKGFGPESKRAIGYKQIIDFVEGKLSLQEAEEQINVATFRFAKKQLTWYKRFEQIRWFEINEQKDIESLVDGIVCYFTGRSEGASPKPGDFKPDD